MHPSSLNCLQQALLPFKKTKTRVLVQHVVQRNERERAVVLVIPALEHGRQELVHPQNRRRLHNAAVLDVLAQRVAIRAANDENLQHLVVTSPAMRVRS